MTPRERPDMDLARYLFRDFTVPAQPIPRRPGTITFHDGQTAEIGNMSVTFYYGREKYTIPFDPSDTVTQIAAKVRAVCGAQVAP